MSNTFQCSGDLVTLMSVDGKLTGKIDRGKILLDDKKSGRFKSDQVAIAKDEERLEMGHAEISISYQTIKSPIRPTSGCIPGGSKFVTSITF